MVNQLILERKKDGENFIAESRKRDEDRLKQRAEAEKRALFEQQMREQRKQFKIGEVQFVSMDEDDKLLKNAGDEMMQAFKSSG